MKVLKPDNLALLYRAYRFDRRNLLAVAMMGYFDFAHSDLGHLLSEADMWKAVPDALGADTLLDEGNAKPRAEFKVYGAAHAPFGREVTEQRVTVRVGGLAKSLVVSGERQFNALGMPSSPKPYARMAIEPSTAFGAPDCADNPRGIGGAAIERDGREMWPLPNVESEAQRLLKRGERVAPAGFWGSGIDAPRRQRFLGACDQRWLASEWPHLPADTRLEFFMSAPQDQWLSGYFKGDEAFEIHGMHPREAVLKGGLPRLRARCFVHDGKPGHGTLREIEARAETVWLFPELERGIVLYRALADVSDSDAADVSHVMAEWEPLDVAPLSFEHYRERFGAQLSHASKAAPAAPAAPADPQPAAPSSPAAAALPLAVPAGPVAEAAEVSSPELAEVEAMAQQLDQQTRTLMAKHGVAEQDLAPFLRQPQPEAVPTLEEVEKMAEALNADTRALMQKHSLTEADVSALRGRLDAPSPERDADLPQLLSDLHAHTQATLARGGLTEADAHAWVAAQPELAALAGSLPPPGASPAPDLAALAMLAQPPKAVQPPAPAAKAEPLPEPAAPVKLTREDIVAMHAARRGFANRDLSGIDLSALDLSGGDFCGALLDKTSFAKSRLEGADFSQALLKETDFTEASLQRARLTLTSGGAGRFAKADLSGAHLADGDFTGADFAGALLEGADLSRALFERASMGGVNASGCRATGAQFIECALDGANFAAASLGQASFERSSVVGGDFTKAQCEQADFQGTQASGAIFADANLSASRADAQTCFDRVQLTRARLARASWDGVQLNAAVLDDAQLHDADLSRAAARGATLRRASAKGAKFAKADLAGADLTGIDLFRGSLRQSTLEGTFLMRANLYGVDFEDARPTLASVEGSNIERTILKFRPPAV
ncbi:DUF2169 domain-containing protein [Caballeronia sp. J97]|uniref:DUF2169 domain-containing protein n=1 Tax=Caballeronia sp. J97 TaxID=2805429 RepID=UPI002AB0FC88|nr:DUF2169 domain-containing protein [Caballeronia sp. J97]